MAVVASESDETETRETGGEGAGSASDARDGFKDVIAAALELDRAHPGVVAWFRAHERLVENVHINPLPGAAGPDTGEVAAAFLELVELIYGRLAPYFDVQSELDALLAIAQPAPADVARLRSLVERPAPRAYFFRRLSQPGWFAPLRDAGLLSAPGVPFTETADGRLLWRAWPEGEYVVRMAVDLPHEVAAFIRAAPASADNPLWWRACVEAAAALPASLSRDLVRLLRRALGAERLQGLGELLIRLALSLARGGEAGQARNLIRDLLVVAPDTVSSLYVGGRVHFSRIGHHEAYLLQTELFPALEELDRPGLLLCASYILRDAWRVSRAASSAHERRVTSSSPADNEGGVGAPPASATTSTDASGALVEEEPVDAVSGVLDGIDLLEQDVEDAEPIAMLARLVARTATDLAREGSVETALGVLGRHSESVFRRIELLVLALSGANYTAEIDATLERIRQDDALRIFWPREVAIFLRGAWEHASASVRERFAADLRAPNRASAREWLKSFRGSEPSEAEVDERVRSYQHSVLALFGRRVPAELADVARAAAYDAAAPNADRLPSLGSTTTVMRERSGPISPLSDDELRVMAPDAVLAFLREWRPAGNAWEDPSVAGLAFAVARYVSDYPQRAAPLADGAITLREPSFLRGILGGLADAAAKGRPIPWPEALRLAKQVATATDSDLPAERLHQADRSWRDAKANALEMLERAAHRDDLPLGSFEDAWGVIDATFENADTDEPPARYATAPSHGARVVGDQLHVARGTLAYTATVAAVRLVMSSARLAAQSRGLREGTLATAPGEGDTEGASEPDQHPPTVEDRRAAAALLHPRIERWLASGRPWLPSVQAAVGEMLPALVWLDPRWLAEKRDWLLDGGYGHPEVNPAWSRFLVRNNVWAPAFEVLRPSYVRALQALPLPPTEASRARESLPEYALLGHVMAAVLAGLARVGDSDRLVETAFTRAAGADLGTLFGHVARMTREAARVSRAPTDPAEAERLARFWSWRLEELSRIPRGPRRDREAEGLGWFFTVQGIPDDEALALLRRTVLVADRLGQVVSLWWPKLAALVDGYPGEVVELTNLVVERHVRDELYRVRMKEATVIVRAGLASGQQSTKSTAERLAHLLGERGYDEMRLLLDEARTPRVATDSAADDTTA